MDNFIQSRLITEKNQLQFEIEKKNREIKKLQEQVQVYQQYLPEFFPALLAALPAVASAVGPMLGSVASTAAPILGSVARAAIPAVAGNLAAGAVNRVMQPKEQQVGENGFMGEKPPQNKEGVWEGPNANKPPFVGDLVPGKPVKIDPGVTGKTTKPKLGLPTNPSPILRGKGQKRHDIKQKP